MTADANAPELEAVFRKMTELDPSWNATGRNRAGAVSLALRAVAALRRPGGGQAVACYRLVRDGASSPADLECWQDGEPSAYMREYAAKEGMRVELAYTHPGVPRDRLEALAAKWREDSEARYPRGREAREMEPERRYDTEGRCEQMDTCADELTAILEEPRK